MQQYVKLLKLTNIKYQKFFEENKILKEKIEIIERNNKEKLGNKEIENTVRNRRRGRRSWRNRDKKQASKRNQNKAKKTHEESKKKKTRTIFDFLNDN